MPFFTNNLFGDIDAELDCEGLKEDYINTNKFYNSMHEQYYLLRGFKGSGKTAFRLRLQMCNDTFQCTGIEKKCNMSLKFCDEGQFEIIFIKADDLKLDDLFEISKEVIAKRKFGIQNDLFVLWKILCKIEVFKKLPELKNNEAYKRFISTTNFDASNTGKIVSALIKGMASLIARDPEIINFTEEFFNSVSDLKNDFEETEKAAIELLKRSNKKYYIFFDGFDKFLDRVFHAYNRDEKQIFILDLTNSLIILGYEVLKDLASIDKDKTVLPNVYYKILLPEDFIIRTEMRDNIKYLDKSILLNWNRNDLKKFIATRIQTIIEKKHIDLNDAKIDQVWDKMFGEYVTNRYHNIPENSFQYFLRHTLFRPRDFQILCSRVVEAMNDHWSFRKIDDFIEAISEKPIPPEYIRSGINSGSRHLVDRLFEEFQTINLKTLTKNFSKKQSIMSYSEVYNLLEENCSINKLNVDETIRTLFNIGFLGKFKEGDERFAEMYRGYPNLRKVKDSGDYYLAFFSFAGYYDEYPTSDYNIAISPVFYDTFEMKVDHRIIYP